jgi:beta-glucanase (GH16 family)
VIAVTVGLVVLPPRGPDGGLSLSASAASAPGVAAAPKWNVVWQDNFDGPAGTLPDPTRWRFDLGGGYPGGPSGWGNHELEQYTDDPANVSLTGQGGLRITPTSDNGVWHSARIETRRSDFAPPPGGSLKIEARIALPAGGKGYWPAFWALGSTFRTHQQVWPRTGELDVMENINSSPSIHGTLHCGQLTGGECDEPHGLSAVHPLPDPAGTHTYTLIWNTAPQELIWQVDGHTYATATPADVGEKVWQATLGHGYFLILNLAIGGTWPGSPDSRTRAGQSMLVDWVRVSSLAATPKQT